MNEALIKEASTSLDLHSMTLTSDSLKTADSAYPNLQALPEIALQLKEEAINVQLMEDKSTGSSQILSFYHSMAMRLVDESDDEQPAVLLEIHATYRVCYAVKDSAPSPEAIKEFAQYNVPHHIWPFWREHVSAMVAKAGYPPILLPMRHH